MSSIFISHSSKDNATAALIREWLAKQGYTSRFLDFDPQEGIPAGRNWERVQNYLKDLGGMRGLLARAAADALRGEPDSEEARAPLRRAFASLARVGESG